MMAIAAREYFMAWDSIRGRDLRIIGVDAVAGAGLEAVEDGRINASFLYPTGGEQVIRTAMRIIHSGPVDKFIPLLYGSGRSSVCPHPLLVASGPTPEI